MHESFLRYRKFRYGWLAASLTALCVLLYASHASNGLSVISPLLASIQSPNGGTWQGYTLGTLATLLVLWLSALGIRKRRYSSQSGSVQGWTSAHVYLGIAALVIATLHSAGQLGWNVHTLAYLCMCVVVLSGLVGVYAYVRYPHLLSTNRAGRTTANMFSELNRLNQAGLKLARHCEPAIMQAVETSIARSAIGGGFWAQILGLDNSQSLLPKNSQDLTSQAKLTRNKDQQAVINFIAECIPRTRKQAAASELQQLLTVLCRRQTLLRQIRRDIQLRAGLQLWLLIHIPFTLALLVSLTLHIISVFFFW